jgi:diguanylate cyclase (GGDEF)-like protein/PAS domain S-box-containing protein
VSQEDTIKAQLDETRRTLKKLRASEARYRQLVEICPDTILVHRGRRILYINPAGLALVGATSTDEVLGRPLTDFVPSKDWLEVRQGIRSMRTQDDKTPLLQQRIRRLDGKELNVEVVSQTTTFQGKGAIQAVIRDISRRQRAEEALRESERRFRDLFEGVPVGIYRLTPEGTFVDVNRALARLLGYDDRKQLIGLESGDLYVEDEHRQAWILLMKQEGEVPDFETQIYRRDGSTIWIRSHTRAVVTKDGTLLGYRGTVEDISAHRQTEQRLRESEDRFRSLVQNTYDVISLVDAEGKLSYQSPSGRRFSGQTERERLGHDAFERIHPDDREEIRSRFYEFLDESGGNLRVEYRMLHKDGSLHVCESIFTNQLANKAVGGVVVTTRDITERKQAEERLQHEALHDSLTGLPNRVLFMDRLQHCLDSRRQLVSAVLFIDLDHFKWVNDHLGHFAGDRFLVEVGRRLRGCVRPDDTLARLGGDEFAMLLDNVTNDATAIQVAERTLDSLARSVRLEDRDVKTSASIGIALASGHLTHPDDLLRDADTAMYRAKAQGRAGYAIFDAKIDARRPTTEHDRRLVYPPKSEDRAR